MFVMRAWTAVLLVDNILISDDVVSAQFSCNLGACRGACCVQGTSGAPLEADEIEHVDRALELLRDELRPAARRVTEAKGAWEDIPGAGPATTCVGGAECVFVVFDGPVAKCAIQKAWIEGRTDWIKPVSCHLYPIRIDDLGDMELVNYERMDMCLPGVAQGRRDGMYLSDYLEAPLTRKYGANWYTRFQAACRDRRDAIAESGRAARPAPEGTSPC